MLEIVVKAFLSAVLEVGGSASTIGAFAEPSSARTHNSVTPEPGTRLSSWSFALEQFQEKCLTVFRLELRENKEIERFGVSVKR
ncbi:hypothetical protein MPL3365_30791 [Mesorhizobium plurifarium]|uniref:Uncharacterized protein n=1 Tax=Mesorhizobium plurifarium TaxID=69974 RepID=A0A090G982_MESPL|nr:hypothetical protein MPL3365_30791 [Mesorhizobium plurifarium]